MKLPGRAQSAFILAWIALFLVVCWFLPQGGIRLIDWYLGMCPEHPRCGTAEWFIRYWWSIFVPVCLLFAWFAYWLYERLFGGARERGTGNAG